MSKEQEKSKPVSAEGKALPADLSEVILDYAKVKYDLIPLTSVHALQLRGTEEFKGRTSAELLEAALRDVINGKATWKSVKKPLQGSAQEDGETKEKGGEKG